MSDNHDYDEWLEARRHIRPTSNLADRIMAEINEREVVRGISLFIRAGLWVEHSRLTQAAACFTALIIGCTPFAFLAYVAQLIVF